MEGNMITLQELAYRVGCSAQTINSYYKFKKENPNSELADKIPDYVRSGGRRTRLWEESAVEQLRTFRAGLTQGRNGALGTVTQRYVSKANKAKAPKPVRLAPRPEHGGYIGLIEELMHDNNVSAEVAGWVTAMLLQDASARAV